MTLFLSKFMGQNQRKSVSTFTCVVILVILFSLVQLNEGQFFTKSSKSIPRMGRRSVSQDGANPTNELLPTLAATSHDVSPYRRSLIEALIDEYGPNLVANLQKAKALARAQQMSTNDNVNKEDIDGEIVLRNDQPSDVGPPGDDYIIISRDERSPSQQHRQQQQQHAADQRNWQRHQMKGNYVRNNQDLSLALRALNARRYLQQLASDQPQGGVFASHGPTNQQPSSLAHQHIDKLAEEQQQQQQQQRSD